MGWNHIAILYHADLKVSHVAICVLHVLAKAADESDQCYPSTSYIAEKMNMSVRSVNRGIQELGDAGLVIWKSGRGNRHVNRYQINVDKLAKLINKCDCVSHLEEDKNSQMRLCVALNATDSHIKCDCVSQGRRNKEDKEAHTHCDGRSGPSRADVDNSTSGQAASAEEVLVNPVPKCAEKAPSAPAMNVKEYGVKPKNRRDLEKAVECCYSLGASIEVAKDFVRYNCTIHWRSINETCSVYILAKEWVRIWKWRTPSEFETENNRRQEIVRIAEEKRLRAIVEKEQNDNK